MKGSNPYNRKAFKKPIPKKTEKDTKDSTTKILEEAFINQRIKVQTCTEMCIKVLFYMILSDKFGFTNEQLKDLKEKIENAADSICKEYMTFDDIVKVCRDEFGMKFTKEELISIDPALANGG